MTATAIADLTTEQTQDTLWIPDLPAEHLLSELGVEYTLTTVPLNQVDATASLQNQARLGVSVVASTVEEYATAMRHGSPFPALVGFQQQNGTYVLAGGNHRLAAARAAGYSRVALYVCRVTDDELRRRITTSLNTLVGARPSREDILIQAVSWMRLYGKTVIAAAEAYGLPREAIDTHLKIETVKNRLRRVGVIADGFARGTMQHLGRISNDPVLREAALLHGEYHLTEPEIREMVGDIKAAPSEREQLAIVERWRGRDDIKARRGVNRRRQALRARSQFDKNRSEVFRVLGSLDTLLRRYNTRAQLGLTRDADLQKAVDLLRQASATIEAMQTPLDVPVPATN